MLLCPPPPPPHPPEQRYWQNRETANIGLVGSVGEVPARISGGRRFKSRSSKFFFVHPKFVIFLFVLQVFFWGDGFLKFSFGFTFHSGCSFPRFVISLKFIGPRYPYLHSVYYFWVCESSGYKSMNNQVTMTAIWLTFIWVKPPSFGSAYALHRV